MHGTRLLIVVSILCLCFLASSVGGVAGVFTDSETSTGNSFQAWTSRLWTQTTQVDFEAGVLVQVDTWSTPGDVMLARDDGVLAFQGGSNSFWKHGNPWTSMANAPDTVGEGGALAYDGGQGIYALQGGGQAGFWSYAPNPPATGKWKVVKDSAPDSVGAGGALVNGGSGFLYALGGGMSTFFWQYDPSNKKTPWSAMADAPAAVGMGGALAYDGSRYIYALQGNNSQAFWRYDTTANTWGAMQACPGVVSAGGALAYDGAGHIFAFQGGGSAALWMYTIASNTWTAMAAAPDTVGGGGSLVCASSGQIYALAGSGSNAFWKYDTLRDSWAVLTPAPSGVTSGGALAILPGAQNALSATVSSAVLDTGIVGDRWDALIWDETLPNKTDITFEVRASDTPFGAGDGAPSWTAVGGTSPISSGLPAGRYKQWRATLTTTSTNQTPRLLEVRLYHY